LKNLWKDGLILCGDIAGNFTGYIEENQQKFRIAFVLAELSPEHKLEAQIF
jgi:hypothetical protein